MIRRHIYFSGTVQGVGFRYRTYYIARSLGLTGWVKNCWDGRVEVEAQGREEDIMELVSQLKEQRFIEIDFYSMEDIPLRPESSFEIAN